SNTTAISRSTPRSSASSCTISGFAVRGRLRWAGPLANHDTQLVGLLLQLAHSLHLHGKVATDFRDLAFNGIEQFGGSAPPLSPPRATYDLGFQHKHSPRAYPDSLGCQRMYRLERNAIMIDSSLG